MGQISFETVGYCRTFLPSGTIFFAVTLKIPRDIFIARRSGEPKLRELPNNCMRKEDF